MAVKLLRKREEQLLQEERRALAALRETLLELGVSKEARQALEGEDPDHGHQDGHHPGDDAVSDTPLRDVHQYRISVTGRTWVPSFK